MIDAGLAASPYMPELVPAVAACVGGTIYASHHVGVGGVWCLDRGTGSVLWEFDLPSESEPLPTRLTLVVIVSGTLVVL